MELDLDKSVLLSGLTFKENAEKKNCVLFSRSSFVCMGKEGELLSADSKFTFQIVQTQTWKSPYTYGIHSLKRKLLPGLKKLDLKRTKHLIFTFFLITVQCDNNIY